MKDKQVCADLGVAGAECAHTYIIKREPLTKAQWDVQRVGWMCMSSDDLEDTEDSVDLLCRNTGLCTYATQTAITQVKTNMAPLISKSKTAKKKK